MHLLGVEQSPLVRLNQIQAASALGLDTYLDEGDERGKSFYLGTLQVDKKLSGKNEVDWATLPQVNKRSCVNSQTLMPGESLS